MPEGDFLSSLGVLRITRRTGMLAVWRPLTVRLSDGSTIQLKRNEVREVGLRPGTYVVSASVRKCISNSMTVSIEPGSTVELVVGYTGPRPAATRNEVLLITESA